MTETATINSISRIFKDISQDYDEDEDNDLTEDDNYNNTNELIFSKILRAANGTYILIPSDVDEIISILCKTMTIGNIITKKEEIKAALVGLLGTTVESCDDKLLDYLTTNYAGLHDIDPADNDYVTDHSYSKKYHSEVC